MKSKSIIIIGVLVTIGMVLIPLAPPVNAQSPTDTPTVTPTPTTPPAGTPTATATATPADVQFDGTSVLVDANWVASWTASASGHSATLSLSFGDYPWMEGNISLGLVSSGDVDSIKVKFIPDRYNESWPNGAWPSCPGSQDHEGRLWTYWGNNPAGLGSSNDGEYIISEPGIESNPTSMKWGGRACPNSTYSVTIQILEVNGIPVDDEPEPDTTCDYDAIGKFTDLMATGTITGKTTFFSCGSYDEPRDCIDFTVTAPLPGYTVDTDTTGYLMIGTSDLVGTWPIEFTVTINDLTPVIVIENSGNIEQNTTQAIPLPPSVNNVTIHVTATVDDIRVNHEIYPYISIDRLMFKAFYGDEKYFNQLCDPGKELPLDDALEYWIPDDDINTLGRIVVTNFWTQIIYDSSACGKSMDLNGQPASHNVYQQFDWSGGTMYWKFKWKNFFLSRGNPYVYLVDTSGNQIPVFGDVVSDEPFNFAWTLETGSMSLSAGSYRLMTSVGAKFDQDGYPISYPEVAYDDFAVGHYPQDEYCEDMREEDELPDLTPTPSITPTISSSGTPTLQPSGTPKPSATWATPRPGTGTPRSTVTPFPSRTVPPIYVTITPGGPTLTPGGPTITAVATGTPGAGGDLPPTDWGLGNIVSCDRPTNPWSVSWWIDYETCRVISFFQFGPVQVATAQALPSTLNTYEPFYTVAELREGINVASTRVASYEWDTTGDNQSGVNDPIDPSEPLNTWGNNPWADGGEIRFTGGLASSPADQATESKSFTTTCYNQLANERLSGRLAQGFCFVISIYRNIGYLSWIQWLLNIASILALINALQVTIGMYSRTTSAIDQIDQPQDEKAGE